MSQGPHENEHLLARLGFTHRSLLELKGLANQVASTQLAAQNAKLHAGGMCSNKNSVLANIGGKLLPLWNVVLLCVHATSTRRCLVIGQTWKCLQMARVSCLMLFRLMIRVCATHLSTVGRLTSGLVFGELPTLLRSLRPMRHLRG